MPRSSLGGIISQQWHTSSTCLQEQRGNHLTTVAYQLYLFSGLKGESSHDSGIPALPVFRGKGESTHDSGIPALPVFWGKGGITSRQWHTSSTRLQGQRGNHLTTVAYQLNPSSGAKGGSPHNSGIPALPVFWGKGGITSRQWHTSSTCLLGQRGNHLTTVAYQLYLSSGAKEESPHDSGIPALPVFWGKGGITSRQWHTSSTCLQGQRGNHLTTVAYQLYLSSGAKGESPHDSGIPALCPGANRQRSFFIFAFPSLSLSIFFHFSPIFAHCFLLQNSPLSPSPMAIPLPHGQNRGVFSSRKSELFPSAMRRLGNSSPNISPTSKVTGAF